jgi:hypothetical protein
MGVGHMGALLITTAYKGLGPTGQLGLFREGDGTRLAEWQTIALAPTP